MRFARKFRTREMLVAGLIGALALLLFFWNPPALRHLESTVLDGYFQLRGPLDAGSTPVALVAIDDHAIHRIGRWPWPRDVLAELVERVRAAGPRAVALDLVFPEPEMANVHDLGRMMRRLGMDGQGTEREMARLARGDARLASVLSRPGPPVVQGYFYYTDAGLLQLEGEDPEAEFERIADSVFTRVDDRAGGRNRVLDVAGLRTNIAPIARATPYGGFLNFVPDTDGALRFASLLVRFHDFYLPSLALAAARAWEAADELFAEVRPTGVEIRMGPHRVQATAQGLAWINFLGPGGTIPTYSAADVLESRVEAGRLAGRLVFVGVTAAGVHDVRATPVDPVMPGTEVQAQLAANLIGDALLARPDSVYLFEFLMIFVVAVGYGLSFRRAVERTRGFLTLALLVAWFAFGYWLFLRGIWLHVVLTALQTVATFAALFALSFADVLYHRHLLKETFSRFVDPEVVEEAIAHEEELALGGEEREISVMFVDVAGFTAMSERLSPQEVVRHINAFFDAATPIVFRHHGCIDRLTGDGLIALFGAPIQDPDHAADACRAALDLSSALDPLRPVFESIGHRLRVRVGINTGRMVVGNMGSSERMQYTFMGDAGNTAARLESLNKQYGSLRMIGPRTAELVADRFVLRELDTVVLVGKHEPITVFELLAPARDREEWAPLLEAYGVALAQYREGRFAEAARMFARVAADFEDAVARTMAERCRSLAEAPPADWNGVWVARSK